MRYTVAWTNKALQELANVWYHATDRNAVKAAADQVDRWLSRNPESRGVDFYGDRLLIIDPLQIVFSVSHDDLLVTVLHVWTVNP